jgi:hypothetical protein
MRNISIIIKFLDRSLFVSEFLELFDEGINKVSIFFCVTSPEAKAAFAAVVALLEIAEVEVGGVLDGRATTGDATSMRTRFLEDRWVLDAVEGMVVGIFLYK